MRQLLICAPVSIAPHLPEQATYSVYESINCPACGQAMWIGERGKNVMAEGDTDCMCMICAVQRGVAPQRGNITRLTDKDN